MATYQVKITGCSSKCFWYKDQIGQVFNCEENEEILNPLVHTVNDVERPEGGWRHILPEDCKILTWQDEAEQSRKI